MGIRLLNVDALAKQICSIGRRLYEKGFVAGNEGNISCRLGRDRFLCTPTLTCKGLLEPADLVVVDDHGGRIEGKRRPSSEIRMHLAIYQRLPHAMAVVHAHPPHVVARAITGRRPPLGVHPEVELFLGDIGWVDYRTPGTWELAHAVADAAATAPAIILDHHGAVGWSTEIERALWNVEILESYCRALWLAESRGEIQPLTPADRQTLAAQRAQFAPSATRPESNE